MSADYLAFPVIIELEEGVGMPAGAGVSVAVRIAGDMSDAAESPLTTDSNGEIAAGSIAAASADDVAYFRIEDEDGLAGCVAQTLT